MCRQGLLEPRYVALALPLCETAEAVEAACTTIARTNASVGDAVVAAALVEAWARIGKQDALVQTVRAPPFTRIVLSSSVACARCPLSCSCVLSHSSDLSSSVVCLVVCIESVPSLLVSTFLLSSSRAAAIYAC